jgi:hypothetical protein
VKFEDQAKLGCFSVAGSLRLVGLSTFSLLLMLLFFAFISHACGNKSSSLFLPFLIFIFYFFCEEDHINFVFSI